MSARLGVIASALAFLGFGFLVWLVTWPLKLDPTTDALLAVLTSIVALFVVSPVTMELVVRWSEK